MNCQICKKKRVKAAVCNDCSKKIQAQMKRAVLEAALPMLDGLMHVMRGGRLVIIKTNANGAPAVKVPEEEP